MRTRALFAFSSFEHIGCRVLYSFGVADNVVVEVIQDYVEVHGIGCHSAVETGAVRVHGILWGAAVDKILSGKAVDAPQQTRPFDITVHAFSPPHNAGYILNIKDCWTVKWEDDQIEFDAVYVVPWHRAGVEKPEPIPPQENDCIGEGSKINVGGREAVVRQPPNEDKDQFLGVVPSPDQTETERSADRGRRAVITAYMDMCCNGVTEDPVVRQFGEDTMHIGPWTTVRACLDCGVLISGGPTRCKYCVDKL